MSHLAPEGRSSGTPFLNWDFVLSANLLAHQKAALIRLARATVASRHGVGLLYPHI